MQVVDPSDPVSALPAHLNKFYGRRKELDQLRQVFQRLLPPSKEDQSNHNGGSVLQEQAKASERSKRELILVEGAPGVGKSRLLEEFRLSVLPSLCGGASSSSGAEPLSSSEQQQRQPRRSYRQKIINHQQRCHPFLAKGKAENPMGYDTSFGNKATTTVDSARPYACLVEACNHLCAQIAALGQSEGNKKQTSNNNKLRRLMAKNIRRALGDTTGTRVFLELVPALADVLRIDKEENSKDNDTDKNANMDATSTKFRLEFLLKSFLTAVVSEKHPLILVLDDIQWADTATLDLLAKLMLDPDLDGIFFVGLYRRDNDTADFVDRIQKQWVLPFLKGRRSANDDDDDDNNNNSGPRLTIALGGLTLEDTEVMLQDALLPADLKKEVLSPPSTQLLTRLASMLLERTFGNCLYLREAILSLARSGLVTYHASTNELQWDEAGFDDFWEEHLLGGGLDDDDDFSLDDENDDNGGARTANNNFQGLILAKLRALSEPLQWCLALVSLLRRPFELADLQALLSALDQILPSNSNQQHTAITMMMMTTTTKPQDKSDDDASVGGEQQLGTNQISRELDQAVLEGLLDNPIGSNLFKFAHDRVQEAAHSLLLLKLSSSSSDQTSDNAGVNQVINDLANNITNSSMVEYHRLCWIIGSYLIANLASENESPPSSSPSTEKGTFSFVPTKLDNPATTAVTTSSEDELRRFYVGVNLLNSVPLHVPLQMTTDKDGGKFLFDTLQQICDKMVGLNLQAGETASGQGAFIPGLQYFESAIQILELQPEAEMWEQHFDLCFRVFLKAAEVSFSLGRFEKGERFVRNTLAHARSTEEKISAYIVMEKGLGGANRMRDAFLVGKEALKMVKRYPKFNNLINCLFQLGKIKKLMKKFTDEEILDFPVTEDTLSAKVLGVMNSTSIRAYMCDAPFDGINLVWGQLFILLEEKKVFPSAAEALTSLAVLCYGPLDDLELGKRVSNLSLRLLERESSQSVWTSAIYNNICYIQAWDNSLMKMLAMTKEGYRRGMEKGQMEYGFLHMALHDMFLFMAGENLGNILSNVEGLYSLARQYNSGLTLSFVTPQRTMIMNISGATEGDPFAWYHDKDSVSSNEQDSFASKIWFHLQRAISAYILGEVEIAEAARSKIGGISQDLSYPTMSNHTFYSGLISAAMFRRTKRRKHRVKAMKKLKLMTKYMDLRGLRMVHRCHLLEADYYSSLRSKRKNVNEVKRLFDKAIVACTRAGFTHDAALANELAGEYFLSRATKKSHDEDDSDEYWARVYLSTAYGLYKTWGAKAKTDRMEENRSHGIDFKSDLTQRGKRLHRPSEANFMAKVSSVHGSGLYSIDSEEFSADTNGPFSTVSSHFSITSGVETIETDKSSHSNMRSSCVSVASAESLAGGSGMSESFSK